MFRYRYINGQFCTEWTAKDGSTPGSWLSFGPKFFQEQDAAAYIARMND